MDQLTKTQKEILDYAIREKRGIQEVRDIPYPLWNQIKLTYDFQGLEKEVEKYLAKQSLQRQKLGFGY